MEKPGLCGKGPVYFMLNCPVIFGPSKKANEK